MPLPRRSLPVPFRVLIWAPLGIIATTHWYNVKVISGPSMQPTLNPEWSLSRDYAIFDRVAVLDKQDCHREDIICLKSPFDPQYKLIKRIVAEEGDIVRTLPPYPVKEVTVPKGHVWVEGDYNINMRRRPFIPIDARIFGALTKGNPGDNPYNSDDSNTFGPVPRALIESKLAFLVWPPSRFGTLQKPEIPISRVGPGFRRAMASFERDAARQARVTPRPTIDLSKRPSRGE